LLRDVIFVRIALKDDLRGSDNIHIRIEISPPYLYRLIDDAFGKGEVAPCLSGVCEFNRDRSQLRLLPGLDLIEGDWIGMILNSSKEDICISLSVG
jgi:hypothetical protein